MNELKLAGVTFANDDGSKRQDILKQIYDTCYRGAILADPIEVLFDGERAVKVTCKMHGKNPVVGWIPKEALKANPILPSSLLLCVRKYEDENKTVYHGYLSERQEPSKRQQRYVQRLRDIVPVTYVASDKRIYSAFIDDVKATKEASPTAASESE